MDLEGFQKRRKLSASATGDAENGHMRIWAKAAKQARFVAKQLD